MVANNQSHVSSPGKSNMYIIISIGAICTFIYYLIGFAVASVVAQAIVIFFWWIVVAVVLGIGILGWVASRKEDAVTPTANGITVGPFTSHPAPVQKKKKKKKKKRRRPNRGSSRARSRL